MDLYNVLIKLSILAIPVIFAITLHEAAHGYVARYFGDNTAYMLGRVTLNPVKHIDPIGTILFPLATSLLGGFIFGWAKPVPVNFNNLRDPKRQMLWVAAAGPGSNVLQAIFWVVLLKLLLALGAGGTLPGQFWIAVSEAGVQWNIVIAILNLFPILPLDGGRIVTSLLPGPLSYQYSRLEPYGMMILILLIVTGVFSRALGPLVDGTLNQIYSIAGLQ